MKCPNCESDKFETDYIRCETICEECGTVCEVNNLQNDVEFNKSNDGSFNTIGTIIETGFLALHKSAINKLSIIINQLCCKLSLTQVLNETALDIFKTLLHKKSTKRIPRQVTAAVCVYMAARLKRVPLMLIELSEKVNISVFTLGKVYKKYNKKIDKHMAITDPCILLERFASQLELGESSRSVLASSMIVLQKIRDDKVIGSTRNPSTIACAALMIGARMHKRECCYEDLARISCVSTRSISSLMSKLTSSSLARLDKIDFIDPKANKPSSTAVDVPVHDCSAQPAPVARPTVVRTVSSTEGESIDLSDSDSDDLGQYFYSQEHSLAIQQLIGAPISNRAGPPAT